MGVNELVFFYYEKQNNYGEIYKVVWDAFFVVRVTYYVIITSVSCYAIISISIWYYKISVSSYSFVVASSLIRKYLESLRNVPKIYYIYTSCRKCVNITY